MPNNLTKFPAGALVPVASGLRHHICLRCWLSDHWKPLGRWEPLCPVLQNIMLHQTSKDYLTGLLVAPGVNEKPPVRNHCLQQKKQEFLES